MGTTVTRDDIAERIARLEAELNELKDAFEKFQDADKLTRPYSFADLAGYFKDSFGNMTLEEIKEYEYKIPERRLRMFDDDFTP